MICYNPQHYIYFRYFLLSCLSELIFMKTIYVFLFSNMSVITICVTVLVKQQPAIFCSALINLDSCYFF